MGKMKNKYLYLYKFHKQKYMRQTMKMEKIDKKIKNILKKLFKNAMI